MRATSGTQLLARRSRVETAARDGHWFYIAVAVLLFALLQWLRQRRTGRNGMRAGFVACMGSVVAVLGARASLRAVVDSLRPPRDRRDVPLRPMG